MLGLYSVLPEGPDQALEGFEKLAREDLALELTSETSLRRTGKIRSKFVGWRVHLRTGSAAAHQHNSKRRSRID